MIGPNGAGKSTLLRAWVGLESLNEGSLAVAGIDPRKARPAALAQVGYVPQAAAIYRELTVLDHIELAARQRPSFDRRLAIRHLAELAISVTDRGAVLSGGQQAQVVLALALGTRAPVLLLDEPLASLDPLARREFLHVLRREARSDGRTVLLSSHVVSDIEQVCDRLVVLGGGQVLFAAPVEEAIRDHSVAEEGAVAGSIVGSFVDVRGEKRTSLVRQGGGRRPTLEELVLGYLAAGRRLQARSDHQP